ncbi:MAG: hypothetical protein AB7P20_13115 [Rhizobiaceae bacterium]
MYSIFSRARKAPYSSVSRIQPDVFGVGEAKRAAWAFAIGEQWPSVDPPIGRASRRGDLPDVDFSQAVRMPRRPVWSRVKAAFRAASSEAIASEEALELPSMLLPVPQSPSSGTAANSSNVIPFRRAA